MGFVQFSDITIVAVLFGCSLVAAYVLFQILKSTAVIQKKEYQVGGAAAGFLIIYGALYGSYYQLSQQKLADVASKDQTCEAKVAGYEKELPLKGMVSPKVKNAQVVLAVRQVALDDDGRFGFTARGLDPKKDDLAIYVISEKNHSFIQLFPDDDPSKLMITAPGE